MPIDAIITLDRLTCSKETDGTGHSEPYLWPVLIRVDDNTLATPELVSSVHVADPHARLVVKQDMKRGDTAPVPTPLRSFRFRFSDNLALHNVVVVVAMLENDETPLRATTRGYVAFRNELPKAIGTLDRLTRLSSNDPAVRDAAIAEVNAVVAPVVRSAIRDGLSAAEKLQVLIGTLNLDDEIAVAHTRFSTLLADDGSTLNQPFSMRFVHRTGSSNSTVTDLYRLTGRFETRRVVVDRCQARVAAVKAAQDEVDAVLREIDELQEEFHGSDGLQELLDAIREEQLVPAQDALDAARAALARCRAGSVIGNRLPVLDAVIA